jgi:hypothetical protein
MPSDPRDGHYFPPNPDGEKKRVIVPRKPVRKDKKVKTHGEAVVNKWRDGSATIRIGRTVVDLMTGDSDYPVEEWSDEELIRGAPMHVGRIPNVIPMVVHVELVRRMMAEVKHRFAAEAMVAVDEHMRLIRASDDIVPANVKMTAIKEFYDRFMGKAPEHVTVNFDGAPPWQKMMASSIVSTEDQAKALEAEGIVEGEIVEEGEAKAS